MFLDLNTFLSLKFHYKIYSYYFKIYSAAVVDADDSVSESAAEATALSSRNDKTLFGIMDFHKSEKSACSSRDSTVVPFGYSLVIFFVG